MNSAAPLRAVVALASLALACAPAGAPGEALPLEEIRLEGLDGVALRPFDPAGPALRAVVFVTDTCPIANGYAPELTRIAADYVERGVVLTLVHVDPEISADEARAHRRDHGLPAAVAIDRDHALVRALGPEVTPEAFVLRREAGSWHEVYRGRIDDQVTDFGKRRLEASSPDLRRALDAALAGQPAEPARTRAVGCPVPPAP